MGTRRRQTKEGTKHPCEEPEFVIKTTNLTGGSAAVSARRVLDLGAGQGLFRQPVEGSLPLALLEDAPNL